MTKLDWFAKFWLWFIGTVFIGGCAAWIVYLAIICPLGLVIGAAFLALVVITAWALERDIYGPRG